MVRRLAVVAAAMVVLAIVVCAALFVWPRSATPGSSADAVVVLAGGQGERLRRAESLMARGVAPMLVISNGTASGWAAANRLCAEPKTYEVVCPTPGTTREEARAVGDLARQRDWDDLVVITSKYHVRRASMLVNRCLPDTPDARIVGAGPPSSFRSWVAVPHESLGLAAALVLRRDC